MIISIYLHALQEKKALKLSTIKFALTLFCSTYHNRTVNVLLEPS